MPETSRKVLQRGFVLLQAAVAEAVAAQDEAALRRVGDLEDFDAEALPTLARVTLDFVCRTSLASGADWTTSTDSTGEPVNIEDRSPAERVWSRRLLAA